MSTRQSDAAAEATAAKRQRRSEVRDKAEDAASAPVPSSGERVATGDIGLIESITVKNFMCHHLLGPFHFGPNVNFIIGNNGSGKSAILTALIVGLGGKAMFTNRGLSLKDFIKQGEHAADVALTLRNRGPDGFKSDLYGDSITVENRISADGSRTYRLKSETGQLITNKKEELTAILDHFNIQLDNPVSILNQEMSKQFLHSKNETDKYKFFMKATLLEQMKSDYIHVKQTKSMTRQQVERQEESLKDLKQDFLGKKDRYERLSSFDELREQLEKLKKCMAWSLVREKELSVEQLKDEIEKEENNHYKHTEHLEQWQTKVMQVERKIQGIRSDLERLREEQEAATQEDRLLRAEAKAARRLHKDKELVYARALNKVKESEKEQSLLEEKINKAKSSVTRRCRKDERKLSELRETLLNLDRKFSDLNQEVKRKHQAVLKGREERDKLRLEQKNLQTSIDSKLRRRTQLLSSRSDKMKRFGESVPELLRAIDEAHAAGRFSRKPLGPIGSCLSVKDPSLCVAVESCLRSFMKTFCCDNHKDESVLQELMGRHYREHRPQIIVCPFAERVYDLKGRKAQHPDFPAVLDMITATSPVVVNCLIDMRGIESVLIVKEKSTARAVMQRGRPPHNCKEAFTVDGDQVYPNRYYASDFGVAKYLGEDVQEQISLLELELENLRAQLNRFQSHVISVTEDIRVMERELNGTIAALKKNQTAINQTKASIAELETVEEEEQDDDHASLEEARLEVQQRMEAEKRGVAEAKEELDQQKNVSDQIEAKHSALRKRSEQLSDEMEPLKEEKQKLEIDCAKFEHNTRHFENMSKNHEENIQEMKSELAQREEELQDFVSKASEICPERQSANGSTKSIDSEITRLTKKLKIYESNHGEHETVVREYAEALALYRQKTSQVRDLKRFINCLDNIMSDRQNRYKILRRSLSVRCKLYFNNFLIKLNCNGSMLFDHNNETLSITVCPPGREEDEVSDMRSLSGGERSFSTVCFMLSLWEITESPFRCLDEFDVYMDMHNRRLTLDLLMELSERQHQRQFIFITPLGTSFLPRTSLIKIHQLQTPE
ncbi:structural maintenance of chromosomes protein 6 [Eucyclogobius newberryi]|uniref:structural maintenance of chromosomes protein 6 n=1 Tax=Eucyclogobius newberryi TaxID=166745 RepID=UPI003B5BB86B